MLSDTEFAVVLARQLHKAPHGKELPERMPYIGDLFAKEERDGTTSLYVWQNSWVLGTKGLKKTSDGRYA